MAQTQQVSPAQINAVNRALIKAKAVKMTQVVYSANSLNPANTPQINIQPRYVGLLIGFWIKVVHTISNGSAVQLDPTNFANLNALSQIQFNDLSNNVRQQTAGWHLGLINSVRGRRPYGTALVKTTGFDSPIDYGSNWLGEISNSGNIPAAGEGGPGTGSMTMWYWLPIAYTEDDLRGTIYLNVVNATAQLTLSFPGATGGVANNGVTVAVANGTDSTQAMYVGDSAGSVALATITNTAVTVYQEYWDQIPTGPYGLAVPPVDIGTIYELKFSTLTAIPQNQDFGYQYVNFRDILSTLAVYVNTASTGDRGVGADINYWALQSANFTNIWKLEPALVQLQTRQFLQVDPPPGVYYFGSRQRPISSTQYGNMQLILNAATANTGAYMLVGIEDFALVQTLSMAGSLPTS